MAEAAGALYTVETVIEAAVAAAKGIYDPTLPLKVELLPVKDIDLPRYAHTVSIVKGRAYVYGGVTKVKEQAEELSQNDIHVIMLPISAAQGTDYKRIASGPDGPPPRQGHTTATIDDHIFIHGGATLAGEPLDEAGAVWTFNTATTTWTKLIPPNGSDFPPSRSQHAAVATSHPQKPFRRTDEGIIPQLESDPAKHVPEPDAPLTYGTLVIHGGISGPSTDPFDDVWSFDVSSRTWSPLPSPSFPVRAAPSPSLAIHGTRLYTSVAGSVQYMDLSASSFSDVGGEGELGIAALGTWTSMTKDSHDEGPGDRSGAFVAPITIGQGRNYLALIGGATESSVGEIWTFQLQPEGMTAASFKDAARMAVKMNTAEGVWAEVKYFDGEGVMMQEGQEGRGTGGRERFSASRDDQDGTTIFVHGGTVDGSIRSDGLLVRFGI